MLGYAVDLIEEIAKQLREYLHTSINLKITKPWYKKVFV